MWKIKIQKSLGNDITHTYEIKIPTSDTMIDIVSLGNKIKDFLSLVFEIYRYTNSVDVYPIMFVAASDIVSNSRYLHISENNSLKRSLIYENLKFSIVNCQLVSGITLITNIHPKEISQPNTSYQINTENTQENAILG